MTASPAVRPVTTPVALLGVGAAAPSLRLAATDVAGAWGTGGGRGTVAVCDADEDTLTLAWQAAVDALAAAGMEAGNVSGLWWGTSPAALRRGPQSRLPVHRPRPRPRRLRAPCAAARPTPAWTRSWPPGTRWPPATPGSPWWWPPTPWSPGSGRRASRPPAPGPSPTSSAALDRPVPGANGSGPAGPPGRTATSVMAAVDRYRGDAERATGDVYDGRLFREEVFLPLLTAAAGPRAGSAGRCRGGVAVTAGWAIADPDGKLAPTVAKRLGGPCSRRPCWPPSATPVRPPPCSVPPGVRRHRPAGRPRHDRLRRRPGHGRRRPARPPRPRGRPPSARCGRRPPVGYVEAIRARGQLEPMSDPIPMGLPPAGAAFVRGNVEMLGLSRGRVPGLRHHLHPALHPSPLHRLRGRRPRRRPPGPPGPGPDLRGEPDHAAAVPGATAHGGRRSRRRRPDHGPGIVGRCRPLSQSTTT